ncbi:MAG: type I 3-dehydroquinate dehydratase [Lachnospiraceae bacterium]|nr:type I 3-dehydroquinate dehydratase [Lachnospiraceae bacterium]
MNTVKIKNITLGEGMPKICVSLVADTLEQVQKQMEILRELPHDMIEVRLDYFESLEKEFIEKAFGIVQNMEEETAVLATFRTRAEGGEREISAAEYENLYVWLLEEKMVDAMDVELFMGEEVCKRLVKKAKEQGISTIFSNHDFNKTPEAEEMKQRLRKMKELGADVVKIAVMPNSMEDVYRLLSVTTEIKEEIQSPVITMSMGKEGMISRLIGESTGSCLTFGAGKKASAPGQISADKLKEVLEIIHSHLG